MVLYTLRCDRLTEDADFGKKNNFFRWSSFWSWRVCKQAKLSHLGHRKPPRIHWKADAPKTSHCLVRILVQKHNWTIFHRKWARRGRYSHVEEEDIGNIWFQQVGATCHTVEATLDILRPVFEDCIISRRADVVWLPRSCDLISLDYYLWGAVKDKCYTDKPETIVRSWKDRVGYCMAYFLKFVFLLLIKIQLTIVL